MLLDFYLYVLSDSVKIAQNAYTVKGADPFLWFVQDIVVGAACADLRHQLDISYPVSNGIVQNWEDMGHVWDHAFYSELKV